MYYCGSTDEPLSKEHVIPYGLGGSTILLKASCASCADKTKQFEEICLRKNFGHLRIAGNFPTRRPKDRPSMWPGVKTTPTGHVPIDVPVDSGKTLLILPAFEAPPKFMTGEEGPAEYRLRIWGAKGEKKELPHGSTIVLFPFAMKPFCQLLAKIAHGKMLTHFAMENVQPVLKDLIIGGDMKIAELFIGASDKRHFSAPPPFADGANLRDMAAPRFYQANNDKWVIAEHLWLFYPYTDCQYAVICGLSDTEPMPFDPEQKPPLIGIL